MDQEPKQQQRRSPLVLVLIIIIVALAAAAVVLVVGRFSEKAPEPVQLGDNQTPLIGYEEGVTVVDDPDALQKAVDKMYEDAAKGGVPVEYKNGASSKDGTKFDCYIANPATSPRDIFITIFADPEYNDQLYLSGLIPPGKALREIELDKKLTAGNHTVYVAYTQVEDDHATIFQQVVVTMDFVVAE